MEIPLVIMVGCQSSGDYTWNLTKATAGRYEIKCLKGFSVADCIEILPDRPRLVMVLRALKHNHRLLVIGVDTSTYWWQADIKGIFGYHTDDKEVANVAKALEVVSEEELRAI